MAQYAQGMRVWSQKTQESFRWEARRGEVGLATAQTRLVLSDLILPILFRQNPAYMPAPVDADLDQRMLQAVESVGLTHNDRGALVPNYSKIGGTVAAAYLGKEMYARRLQAPELASTHFVLRYLGYSLLGDLATNVAHELVRAAIEPDLTMYNLHGSSTSDSYYPLSLGGKAVTWMRGSYSLRNLATASLICGLPRPPQMPSLPYQAAIEQDELYGNQVMAWREKLEEDLRYHERRFVGGLAEAESQVLLQQFVIPALSNVDSRYTPLGSGGAGSRTSYAFRSIVYAKSDSGGRTVNLPVLLGTMGAALIAKEFYYNQLGTPTLTSNRVLEKTVSLNLAADILLNLTREFHPHRDF